MMTDLVTYRKDGQLGWIQLDDGKVNAFGSALIEGLHGALDEAERHEPGAVVLTGREGIFSAGLNLKVLPQLEAPNLKRVLDRYVDAMLRVFTFPRPVVAHVCGHALAGGAVTILACDARIGARGPFKIGLNEVAIRIALPTFAIEIAAAAVKQDAFTRTVLHGDVVDPEEALRRGLLDELHEADSSSEAARSFAARLAELPADSYRRTKERIRGPRAERARALASQDLAEYLSGIAISKNG